MSLAERMHGFEAAEDRTPVAPKAPYVFAERRMSRTDRRSEASNNQLAPSMEDCDEPELIMDDRMNSRIELAKRTVGAALVGSVVAGAVTSFIFTDKAYISAAQLLAALACIAISKLIDSSK